ncbi:MAG TPA: VOC family protein [Tepidisphaeraceae bacterium]|jgi:predicted enzyme related to lactoylglutathione lyase|nr:VOC family protein [Tepidisphaeraceae bacterium]
MILGLRTAIYPVADLAAAKAWYGQVLNAKPYFDEPFYVGFSSGGFELGLLPSEEAGIGGVQAYWAAVSVADEFARLVSLGATVHEPPRDVGAGIKVASVIDPFGNRFSIIENPHFSIEAVR